MRRFPMRIKTRTWIVVSLLLFVAAGMFWHWGDEQAAREKAAGQPVAASPDSVSRAGGASGSFSPSDPLVGSFFSVVATNVPNGPERNSRTNRLRYQVRNTGEP